MHTPMSQIFLFLSKSILVFFILCAPVLTKFAPLFYIWGNRSIGSVQESSGKKQHVFSHKKKHWCIGHQTPQKMGAQIFCFHVPRKKGRQKCACLAKTGTSNLCTFFCQKDNDCGCFPCDNELACLKNSPQSLEKRTQLNHSPFKNVCLSVESTFDFKIMVTQNVHFSIGHTSCSTSAAMDKCHHL